MKPPRIADRTDYLRKLNYQLHKKQQAASKKLMGAEREARKGAVLAKKRAENEVLRREAAMAAVESAAQPRAKKQRTGPPANLGSNLVTVRSYGITDLDFWHE